MAKIVLAGFDSETAKLLTEKLSSLNHQTELCSCDSNCLSSRQGDLLFLSGDDVRCQRVLASLKVKSPAMPVIVSSRAVDDSLWLAALEAGATDYCSVDVDPANLAWMLENALELRVFAGAA